MALLMLEGNTDDSENNQVVTGMCYREDQNEREKAGSRANITKGHLDAMIVSTDGGACFTGESLRRAQNNMPLPHKNLTCGIYVPRFGQYYQTTIL